MARKKKGDIVNGWINLDKPVGLTSTQALGKVRRILNAQKAGHAGTLDPLASGILPIALGEATKTIPFVQDSTKVYEFTVRWGERRTTDDAEGDIVEKSDIRPTFQQIQALLPKYTGHIQQIPPQFSAIKVDGQRAYDLARGGEIMDLKPREIFVGSLESIEARPDEADFRLVSGKGAYVRSLARDMGADLGCQGYISALRRTRVGPYAEETSISLDKLAEMADIPALERVLLPLATALDDIPALAIREDETARLRNGQSLSFIARPDVDRLKNAGLGIDKTYKEYKACTGI
jgi:tRNA pseudouridine55 synthase